MNALLEGDVGRGRRHRHRQRARAAPRPQAHPGRQHRARPGPRRSTPSTPSSTPPRGLDDERARRGARRASPRRAARRSRSAAPSRSTRPSTRRASSARADALGLPACAGHELTGAYGLETRTVSAAINASILPVVERTAGVVERALERAGLDVPLLVLRGDGGAMSARRLPPAAVVHGRLRARRRASPRRCTSSGSPTRSSSSAAARAPTSRSSSAAGRSCARSG